MFEKQAEKWIVGAALAVAASTLVPMMKQTLQSAADRQDRSGLTDKMKYLFQIAREEVEDIVAEAQFERMKKRLDQDIASD